MVDNVSSPIPAATKFKSKDTGANGHLMGHTLFDTAEAEVLGTVTASPTANTVLARLKNINDSLAAGAATVAKAEDVASANADVGIPAMGVQKATPANTAGTDGDYEFLQLSAGRLWTSATVYGDTSSGASDAGNPVKIGGIAKTANPTAVTDGQRVNAIFDKLGKQVVVGAIRDLKGMQSTTITSSTAETTIVTAVASTFLDLFGLVITNTSATITKVTIKDSTSGTTRAVYEVPATDTRSFMLPVDSALPQATVNTNWTATCGTSVASVEIAAYFVKNI